MKRIWIGLITAGMAFGLLNSGEQAYSPEDLKKALDIVRRIEQAEEKGSREIPRKVSVTEDVLNAYLGYRADLEGGPLKNLEVKLFPDRQIEGKLFIDLSGFNPPRGLKQEMTFYFRSKIEIRNGRGRLDIQELFLEKQQVDPVVLNLAIFFLSQIQNTEASGIGDWYELPYGIKDLKTYREWCEIYY